MANIVTVGVLALQGAFSEHIQLLRHAATLSSLSDLCKDPTNTQTTWSFIEVRTAAELNQCDGLIIPGGESTAISLVAERSGLLEPLREFVKVLRKPTWGTCAGLILLSESANRTKKGGQELIGGLDVRVNRNHFGRQVESFEADLDLPFLQSVSGPAGTASMGFRSVFIRAPVVERILPHFQGVQLAESVREDTIIAPSKKPADNVAEDALSSEVEVMGRLPGRAKALNEKGVLAQDVGEAGDIIAVRQGNCFGTSFHPELTGDGRIHEWWLTEVLKAVRKRRGNEAR